VISRAKSAGKSANSNFGESDLHGVPFIPFLRTVRRRRAYIFYFCSLFWIFVLVNSFSVSEAIHFAVLDFMVWICWAVWIAALFRVALRFPICRKAQLTAFLTKFRLSVDSLFIMGRNFKNSVSFACMHIPGAYVFYPVFKLFFCDHFWVVDH